MIESGKRIIANDLINSLNYLLEFVKPVICIFKWKHISPEKTII